MEAAGFVGRDYLLYQSRTDSEIRLLQISQGRFEVDPCKLCALHENAEGSHDRKSNSLCFGGAGSFVHQDQVGPDLQCKLENGLLTRIQGI